MAIDSSRSDARICPALPRPFVQALTFKKSKHAFFIIVRPIKCAKKKTGVEPPSTSQIVDSFVPSDLEVISVPGMKQGNDQLIVVIHANLSHS